MLTAGVPHKVLQNYPMRFFLICEHSDFAQFQCGECFRKPFTVILALRKDPINHHLLQSFVLFQLFEKDFENLLFLHSLNLEPLHVKTFDFLENIESEVDYTCEHSEVVRNMQCAKGVPVPVKNLSNYLRVPQGVFSK